MILIVFENNDMSVRKVIDHLFRKGVGEHLILINEYSLLSNFKLVLNNRECFLKFSLNSKIEVDTREISSYYYRRGVVDFVSSEIDLDLGDGFTNYWANEKYILNNFVHTIFESVDKSIGSFKQINVNKLDSLLNATKCGFRIPQTIVSNNWEHLSTFLLDKKRAITKGISDVLDFNVDDINISALTLPVTIDVLEQFKNNKLLATLLQEEIIKNYEIRTFYFRDNFYSMAIFSQNNSKTMVDFRNYDTSLENRCIPYIHSDRDKEKISNFMKSMKLNTGSLDFIVSKDESELTFLEVNPDGQFDALSSDCNYFIEEDIADYLSSAL